MELSFLADLATLGFAISLSTSASVALAALRFCSFPSPYTHDFTSPGGAYRTGQYGSNEFSLTAIIANEAVITFSSFRSSDLSQSI